MLTKQFKVTIATALGVVGLSAFGVSQFELAQRLDNVERVQKTSYVTVVPSPTLTTSPTASPTAMLKPKVVPTHQVLPNTTAVTVTPPIR